MALMAADVSEHLQGHAGCDHANCGNHDDLQIVVTFAGETFTINLPLHATVNDIALFCESELRTPSSLPLPHSSTVAWQKDEYTVSKLIAPPPLGLINVARDADTNIATLITRLGNKYKPGSPLKLRLMASRTIAVDALRKTGDIVKQREARLADLRGRARPAATVSKTLTGDKNGGFTFADIRPLPHLPEPAHSLAFLHRLCNDVGIRHVMRRHRLRVGLLTEMDPLQYTQATHEGTTRILGLNRNQGQVIELRLRTDAGDGYRDYKTVRRTLCHELAHNVHSSHDQHFWALYRQLERETEAADYRGNGGRSLEGGWETDYYEPASPSSKGDLEEHIDSGGWTGGAFVLGSGEASIATATAARGAAISTTGLTNLDAAAAGREARARAAEERLRRMGSGGDSNGSNSGSGGPNTAS